MRAPEKDARRYTEAKQQWKATNTTLILCSG